MSITDDKKPGLKRASTKHPSPVRKPLFRRPGVLAVAGVVATLLVGGTLWAVWHGRSESIKTPPRTAPITLPGTLAGLTAKPLKADFVSQPIWQTRAKAASSGAVVTGRSYASTKNRRTIRVVAGRADLTGKLEFAWAADAGKEVTSSSGKAHCTQNLVLAAGSRASVRPTMILCWRVLPTLSAYAAVIDLDHHPVPAEGLAALDAIWNAALTGR
jgi:hypothetical protein